MHAKVEGEGTGNICVENAGEGLIPLWTVLHISEINAEELSNPIPVKGRLCANLAY